MIVASKENTDERILKKETIYLKTTGEYFLLFELTSYGEKRSSIYPIHGRDGFRDWANENMSVDEYEATFGPVAE